MYSIRRIKFLILRVTWSRKFLVNLGVHTINLPSPSIFLKLIEKVRPDLYQKLWGDVVIDRQLALSAIGYEPRYTLEDGIREMVESFKQQK